MYERFEQLLKEHGISTYRVAKDTKITTSLFSQWKSGKNQPKTSTLQKIADYFGVSIEWLLGNTEVRNIPDPKSGGALVINENPLSANERELIDMYRQLPPELQKMIADNIKACYRVSAKDKLDEEKAM
ncbi:helix-turn-helix domain-containing protein [Megamonas hypermegale]|uniref:helix-turn-helix domain-containing protein n=1 Tax=Megamonas hypermegale TaxID=158847 RepID=UPI0026EFFE06|nr:helix-turn-helix domain-containing protein [Megamonas hypermegale]